MLELHTGDRMNREEFDRAYATTPEGFKAELIGGGIVYVASPRKLRHGIPHLSLGAALVVYKAATPGVEAGDNVTVQLGYDAELVRFAGGPGTAVGRRQNLPGAILPGFVDRCRCGAGGA